MYETQYSAVAPGPCGYCCGPLERVSAKGPKKGMYAYVPLFDQTQQRDLVAHVVCARSNNYGRRVTVAYPDGWPRKNGAP